MLKNAVFQAQDTVLHTAILPAGGCEGGCKTKFIEPKKVMPIHYNTFDLIAQDAEAWADRVRQQTQTQPVVLKPGDWLDV